MYSKDKHKGTPQLPVHPPIRRVVHPRPAPLMRPVHYIQRPMIPIYHENYGFIFPLGRPYELESYKIKRLAFVRTAAQAAVLRVNAIGQKNKIARLSKATSNKARTIKVPNTQVYPNVKPQIRCTACVFKEYNIRICKNYVEYPCQRCTYNN